MSAKDIRDLLDRVDDTRELVLGSAPERDHELRSPVDELLFCWREAEDEATCAYQLWREHPGADAYAVYIAAADRSEAAQQALQWSWMDAGIAA
jgi:hypothetical protein